MGCEPCYLPPTSAPAPSSSFFPLNSRFPRIAARTSPPTPLSFISFQFSEMSQLLRYTGLVKVTSSFIMLLLHSANLVICASLKSFQYQFLCDWLSINLSLITANLYCKLGGCHLSKLSITQLIGKLQTFHGY